MIFLLLNCQVADGIPTNPITSKTFDLEHLEPSYDKRIWNAAAIEKHDVVVQLSKERLRLLKDPPESLIIAKTWAQIMNNDLENISVHKETVANANKLPLDYKSFMLGVIAIEEGQTLEAIRHLDALDSESILYSNAQIYLLKLRYKEIKGIKESDKEIKKKKEDDLENQLSQLLHRDDPSEFGERVLDFALTYTTEKRKELFSTAISKEAPNYEEIKKERQRLDLIYVQEIYNYTQRLWSSYPLSKEFQKWKSTKYSLEKTHKQKPTRNDYAQWSDTYMILQDFSAVIESLSTRIGAELKPDEPNCRIWYAYGRSQFKKNNVTASLSHLNRVATKCKTITPDLGAKALYIQGKGLERRKEWAKAAAKFARIPVDFPKHSMADDGYSLSGIAYQESDNMEKALTQWKKQIEEYPLGDMIAETSWRLAWSLYRLDRTPEAIEIAENAKNNLPLYGDPTHALALYYWAARWRLYPNASKPRQRNEDVDQIALGIADLELLCKNEPSHYYGLLAAQRLREEAPEKLSLIKRPSNTQKRSSLKIPVLEGVKLQRGLDLHASGLIAESIKELSNYAKESPLHMSIYTQAYVSKDPIVAHDQQHKHLNTFAHSLINENKREILEEAFPERYWDIIESFEEKLDFDPRIFQGLVREESSFNPRIVSWAGAKGLSQLMPSTAKMVAGWIGISVSGNKIYDPKTNLQIGSTYLNHLHERFQGNSFLAIASYNAGPGNVNKWLKEKGNLPTDEYVESIPIRETRGYVKRVLSTYQTYRYLYADDVGLFPDYTSFNHYAQLE